MAKIKKKEPKKPSMWDYVPKVNKFSGKEEIKQIGVVGVDSGQVVICDPCYIDSEWENEDVEFSKGKPAKNNFSYNACCQVTMNGDAGQLCYKLGHAGVGVVSTSGYGDGLYPVYATIDKESGRIKELKIVFF